MSTEQELRAENERLKVKIVDLEGWVQALTDRVDTQTEMMADAGLVQLRTRGPKEWSPIGKVKLDMPRI